MSPKRLPRYRFKSPTAFLPSRPFFSLLSALNNDTKHFGHFSCLPNNAPRSSIHVVCLCAHRAKRAVAIPSFRMMLLKYGLPLRRCHRRTHSLALPLEERILASFWLCVKTTGVSLLQWGGRFRGFRALLASDFVEILLNLAGLTVPSETARRSLAWG